jgi:hypothetical protein
MAPREKEQYGETNGAWMNYERTCGSKYMLLLQTELV